MDGWITSNCLLIGRLVECIDKRCQLAGDPKHLFNVEFVSLGYFSDKYIR